MSHLLPLPQRTGIMRRGATLALRRAVDPRLAIYMMQWDCPRRNAIRTRSASIAIGSDSVARRVTAERPADTPQHCNASPSP